MNNTLKKTVFFILLIVITACGGGSDSSSVAVGTNPRVSGCDGFDTMQSRFINQQEEFYDCRDERLLWQYNEASQIVHFLNKDVWLNCCGEHSISISMDVETGKYTIVETDDPLDGDGRCSCMCFFDFAIDLNNPTTILDTIYVTLIRVIDGHEDIVWEGELILSNSEGDELIEGNVGYSSCKESVEESLHN
jgi:hypothetical protein